MLSMSLRIHHSNVHTQDVYSGGPAAEGECAHNDGIGESSDDGHCLERGEAAGAASLDKRTCRSTLSERPENALDNGRVGVTVGGQAVDHLHVCNDVSVR